MGKILWARHCGQDIVAKTLWRGHCGQDIVAKTLWPRHCGQEIVAKTLWPRHCGQDIAGMKLVYRRYNHSSKVGGTFSSGRIVVKCSHLYILLCFINLFWANMADKLLTVGILVYKKWTYMLGGRAAVF